MPDVAEIELLAPLTPPDIESGSVEEVSPVNDGIFGDLLEPRLFLDLTDEEIRLEMVEPIGTGSGGGSGGTIPSTVNLLKGDGIGNAADSKITSGNDVAMSDTVPAFVMCTADGKRADSSNGAHYGKVSGITLVAVNSGNVANLIDFGEVVNGAWSFSAGQVLFLNGQNISATPPASGFVQMVAVARNPTTIIMKIGVPVLL